MVDSTPTKATIVNVPTQVEQAYQLVDGKVISDKELMLEIYNSLEEIKKKLK